MKTIRYSVLVLLSSLLLVLVHAFGGTQVADSCHQVIACGGAESAPGAIAALASDLTNTASAVASGQPGAFAAAATASAIRFPFLESLEGRSIVVLGLVASLFAGLATGVGAIPVLFTSKISNQLQGTLLGFAAGVMLAATSFSLLIPAIERVTEAGGSGLNAAAVAVGGTLLGSIFIWVTDLTLPYQRLIGEPDGRRNYRKLKGIWLFIIAIAIHNFPEGLAVGVGFGGENIGNGIALAIGIGLQNIPEGLAVALALVTQHYSKWTAFWIALATGLVEPIGGVFGVAIIALGEALLPWGLAFAAGAMLFVIGDEVIPEAQSLGSGKLATAAIVGGFVIMMFLDVALS